MCTMSTRLKFVYLNNLHDLPTYQKRLRHLRCLAVRNLSCGGYHGKEITRMQTYFTLHKDNDTKAFYTSEKITGSVNPTWKSFNISQYEKDIDTKSTFIVLRIWVGENVVFKLLIEMLVHLTGLVFFAEKLQHGGVKYAPNTVIFGMFDKYFTAQERSLQQQITVSEKSNTEEEGGSSLKNAHVLRADQSTVRNSYTTNSVSRIHTILKATKQTQASVNRVHSSIEDRLLSSQEVTQKLSEREKLLMKVGQLHREFMWQSVKRQCESDNVERVHLANKKRENALKEEQKVLDQSRKSVEEKKNFYVQTREMLVKENAQLLMRRKQLVGEMASYIYPISEDSKKQFCICGVRLPNSEEFQGRDETSVAVALGSTCHLTMMISQFLDFPLRYPMEARGSRAQIKDHIHVKLSDKEREFPLYSKGKEKFQFNYGVFLLNKNISQIRFYAGLGTTDLRMTLPNLKALLELRLGVKTDTNPNKSMLTPTSGTGNSIISSAALGSSHSIAGSSSTNSLTLKYDITRLSKPIDETECDKTNNQTMVGVENDDKQTPQKNNDLFLVNNDDKQTPQKNDDLFLVNDDDKQKSQTNDDLFLASDDDFFRIHNSISKEVADGFSSSQPKELTTSDSLEVLDDGVVLLSERRLDDLEAVKATLQIHFDNDVNSSPRSSCDSEASSGDGKHDGDKVTSQNHGHMFSGDDRHDSDKVTSQNHGHMFSGEDRNDSNRGTSQNYGHAFSGDDKQDCDIGTSQNQNEGYDKTPTNRRELDEDDEFRDLSSTVIDSVERTNEINACVSSTFKTSAFRGHKMRDLSPGNSSHSSISDEYPLTAEVVS